MFITIHEIKTIQTASTQAVLFVWRLVKNERR